MSPDSLLDIDAVYLLIMLVMLRRIRFFLSHGVHLFVSEQSVRIMTAPRLFSASHPRACAGKISGITPTPFPCFSDRGATTIGRSLPNTPTTR